MGGDCSLASWAAAAVPKWSPGSPFAISNSSFGFFDISLSYRYSREVQMLLPDTPATWVDVRPGHVVAGKPTAHGPLLHVTPMRTSAMIALRHFTELAACQHLLLLVLLVGIFAPNALKRKHKTRRSTAPRSQVAAKLRYALSMGPLRIMAASLQGLCRGCAQTATCFLGVALGSGAASVESSSGQAFSNRSRAAVPAARAAKQRTKVARLVFGLLLTLAGKASAFSDKASLQVALGEWCADAAAAQATHGPISAWDVSAVTDMATLLYFGLTCRSTFDEDLNAWDVGQVTNMYVRRRPRREPEGLGCWLAGGRSFATAQHLLRRAVARRRQHSITQAPSTSPWKRGTLARSPACRCAATRTSGAGGVHRSTHSACACCVRGAEYVLQRKRFQPARGCVGRWPGHQHVGAPPSTSGAREGWGGWPRAVLCHTVEDPQGAALCHRSTHSACACCVRGAESVHVCERLQPARGSVGRWPGQQHASAPPPTRRELEGLGWLAGGRRPFVTGALTRRARAMCAAQAMFLVAAFNQPVDAWDVGKVTNMNVRRARVGSRRGWGGSPGRCPLPPEHPLGVRVRRRSVCSCPRALSTSQWKRGTLARSPTWMCAAARVGSRRGWGGGRAGGPLPLKV